MLNAQFRPLAIDRGELLRALIGEYREKITRYETIIEDWECELAREHSIHSQGAQPSEPGSIEHHPDSARLDWMERVGSGSFMRTFEKWSIAGGYGPTLRAAIDDGIEKSSQGAQPSEPASKEVDQTEREEFEEFVGDHDPPVTSGVNWHPFAQVRGNRFCGVCGGGPYHSIHSQGAQAPEPASTEVGQTKEK